MSLQSHANPPWDSTQLLGHWQILFLTHTHSQKVCFCSNTSHVNSQLLVSDSFCCWRVNNLQLCVDVAGQAWHVTNQKQQHAGYTLSDDTAFTQKQTELSADLRRRPALNSTYSTYWLLKLRVSEFTLKEAGRIVSFPWGVCWRIDGSAHPCFTVSAIFRPCEHVCCQPLAPRGPKPLACPPSIVSCLFKVLISSFQRCSLNQTVLSLLCVFCSTSHMFNRNNVSRTPPPSVSFMFYKWG